MQAANVSGILLESRTVSSGFLARDAEVDFYFPSKVINPSAMSLLLINDGQNMQELGLSAILEDLYAADAMQPLLCVAIHAGDDRKMEYGVASKADYLGRGAKAGLYTSFIIQELLPFISHTYKTISFKEKAFAGFSLGALTALDIVVNHPDQFTKAGLFSGSFWWRSIDQTEKEYSDDKHRIMQQEIKTAGYHPELKFFFQCGTMDETHDRNNNGIIDSIDNTRDMISELVAKGYHREKDIHYLEMADGKHDIATWAKAMPVFLKWAWGV